MEACYVEKSNSNCDDRSADRIHSSMPSLAQVLVIVFALVFVTALSVSAISTLRAQRSLVRDMHAELAALTDRVNRLEAQCAPRALADDSRKESEGGGILTEVGDADATTQVEGLPKPYATLNRNVHKFTGDMTNTNETSEGDKGIIDFAFLNEEIVEENEEEEEAADELDYDDTKGKHFVDDLFDQFDTELSTNVKQANSDVNQDDSPSRPIRMRERRQADNRESETRRGSSRSGAREGRESRTSRAGNGHNGRQRERGQRNRCRRYQECMPQPAFAHFEGDIESAALVHTWIHFWRFASWTPFRQRNIFTLVNGNVTVQEGGIYYIYSQIQYYDDARYSGHEIFVNGVSRFKCAECPVDASNKINTCYIGGLVYLHANSTVGIRLAFPNRTINLHHDSSYFGLYKVA